jgi:NMT1/THI5 like
MKNTVIGVFTLWILFCAALPAVAQLKKIRFSTTSIAVTELQFRIAQLKGFYRDEGLDLETILIRGAVGMQALLGGSVDYSSAAGALIAAAVRGAPVRLVLIVNAKPQFELVAQPEIKAIAQLKGKLVGISSRGGAVDLLTQMILTQNGLTPNKDTTLLVIGTPEEMALALRTGRIAACLLSPPRQLMLYREGFTHPSEVFSFVRAGLRGLHFYTQNRGESIEIMSKHLGIKDRSLAAEVYDLHLSRLGGTSYLDEAWMRGAIVFTKKSLGVAKETAPNQVFDFSFAEKARSGIKN